MQMSMRNGVTLKLTLTLTLTDTDSRCCPDPNAWAQKFIHHMATTPQLQNSMWIEFAHTHLHTTPNQKIFIATYWNCSNCVSQLGGARAIDNNLSMALGGASCSAHSNDEAQSWACDVTLACDVIVTLTDDCMMGFLIDQTLFSLGTVLTEDNG